MDLWWRKLGSSPEIKNIIFCPQNSKVWLHYDAVFNRQKNGQLLETSRYGFYGSIAKLSLQKHRKNKTKIRGHTK